MKISITDQFLWDVYDILQKGGDITRFIFKRRRTLYDILPGSKNPTYRNYLKAKNERQFRNLIYRLKKNNLIKVKNLEGKQAVILTRKGIDRALKNRFKKERGNLKKRKDGKWIMIIFDIPQKYNKSRNLLRSILQNLGYKMFQQSVWVTPYDVSRKTEELLQQYSLDDYVKIFLIEKI